MTANLEKVLGAKSDKEDASESISFNACEVAKQAVGVKEMAKEHG